MGGTQNSRAEPWRADGVEQPDETNAKHMEEVWKVGVRAIEDEEGIVRREELQRCVRQVMVREKMWIVW